MSLDALNVNRTNNGFKPRYNSRLNNPYRKTNAYNNVSFTRSHNITHSKPNNNLSFTEGSKCFAKGLVSPITGMFKSVKSFALGVGTIAASAALVVATGGAAAPLLVAVGLGMGAIQAGKSIYMLSHAKTKKQKEDAIYEAGAATGTIGLSALGAKTAIKQAGTDVEGLNILSASSKTIKSVPNSVKSSYSAFKEGFYKENIRSALKPLTAKSYEKKLSREIYQNAKSNFDNDVTSIRKMLPASLQDKLKVRIKCESSSYDKLIKRSDLNADAINAIKSNANLTQEEKLSQIAKINKNKVDDQLGARLETNTSINGVVHLLAKLIKNDEFEIPCLKNYRNPHDPNSFYFSRANIEELQDAAHSAGKEITILQNVKSSGYCATQIKVKFKSGVLGEIQIRGNKVGEMAELEHIRYDLNANKDIFKGNTELIKLFSPYKKSLKNLTAEQKKAYDSYFVDLYEWARNSELGIKCEKPNLPEGLDKQLSIDNIKILYEKLHNTKLSGEKNYNLLPEISFLYGISQEN